jgi:YD repeat-containing protein
MVNAEAWITGEYPNQKLNLRLPQGVAGPAREPGNPVIAVTYNANGSVASVTEDGVPTVFTYNPDGSVATQTRAGITRTFSYDLNGNLTGAN